MGNAVNQTYEACSCFAGGLPDGLRPVVGEPALVCPKCGGLRKQRGGHR